MMDTRDWIWFGQYRGNRIAMFDTRTDPVTFWVGSNHGASIIKLEPLD